MSNLHGDSSSIQRIPSSDSASFYSSRMGGHKQHKDKEPKTRPHTTSALQGLPGSEDKTQLRSIFEGQPPPPKKKKAINGSHDMFKYTIRAFLRWEGPSGEQGIKNTRTKVKLTKHFRAAGAIGTKQQFYTWSLLKRLYNRLGSIMKRDFRGGYTCRSVSRIYPQDPPKKVQKRPCFFFWT